MIGVQGQVNKKHQPYQVAHEALAQCEAHFVQCARIWARRLLGGQALCAKPQLSLQAHGQRCVQFLLEALQKSTKAAPL